MSNIGSFFSKIISKIQDFITENLTKWMHIDIPDLSNIDESIEDSRKNDTPAVASPETPKTPDSADFTKFDFKFGGFKGGSASYDSAANIKGLSVNPSGNVMTYSWCQKMSGLWGSGYSDADALACIFIPSGDKWIGGKFDWISASRTSRDLKNIRSGYNGWDWNAFSASRKFAFVIISKDGKKRTNVITCGA